MDVLTISPGKISALYHEVLDHPMELGALVALPSPRPPVSMCHYNIQVCLLIIMQCSHHLPWQSLHLGS